MKIREKVDVVSNVSMKFLVLLTTKTNARNWTTKSNRNVTYAANFLCKVHHKSTKYVREDCFVADEQTLARNIYYNFQCFVIYSTLFLNWTVCSWKVIQYVWTVNRKLYNSSHKKYWLFLILLTSVTQNPDEYFTNEKTFVYTPDIAISIWS